MCYVYLGLTSNRSLAVPEWLARGFFRTRPQRYCFFLTYASKLKIFVPKDKKILRFVVPEDKKNVSGAFFCHPGNLLRPERSCHHFWGGTFPKCGKIMWKN